MLTWGATPEEAEATMSGDEIVGRARYQATHAVTIEAPVEQVWPWLVQMGQGRGGLYSYDRVENLLGLDIHSADHIVPELQDLAVGDVIRMVPEGTEPDLHFLVAYLEPPHLLVLSSEGSRRDAYAADLPFATWAFHLREVDESTTRLVVRFRSDFRPTPSGWITNKYALEPVHFVMERKMLLGIKERAERAARVARDHDLAIR